jgi:hypothetical protein
MPANNPLNAYAGSLANVPGCRAWEIGRKAQPQTFVDSGTGGGTGRRSGNADWSGTIDCNGAIPAYLPGDDLPFCGSLDGSTGVSGDALVDQVAITWDLAAAKVVQHTIALSGNGPLAEGPAAAGSMAVALPQHSKDLQVLLANPGGSTWTPLAHVQKATLTLRAANVSYVENGIVYRRSGNLDWSLAVPLLIDSQGPGALPALSAVQGIQLFVDATNYWELLWAIFGQRTNLKVDIETKAMIGCTLNASMAAVATIAGSDALGSITLPGGTSPWWPTSGT